MAKFSDERWHIDYEYLDIWNEKDKEICSVYFSDNDKEYAYQSIKSDEEKNIARLICKSPQMYVLLKKVSTLVGIEFSEEIKSLIQEIDNE